MFFLVGYYVTDYFLYVPSIETPELLGKNINQVVNILSGINLNVRIIQEKEDNDLPEGTILSQSPAAHQKIKTNQTMFCVISRQSQTKTAPNFINKTFDTINDLLKKERIRAKIYEVPGAQQKGYCIAQFPQAGQSLQQRSITLYSSDGNKKAVLFPSLIGRSLAEVQEFLTLQAITPSIFHQTPVDKNHQCSSCRIIEQKPLPGSIIDSTKSLRVQLQVK